MITTIVASVGFTPAERDLYERARDAGHAHAAYVDAYGETDPTSPSPAVAADPVLLSIWESGYEVGGSEYVDEQDAENYA